MLENYLAISVYLVILVFITWLSARRKSLSDFLSASHDVGWKPLALSVFSSVISSYNIVVTLTFAFIFGPYIFIVYLGALGAFIGIYFIARKYRDIIDAPGFNNIIDLFADRFDTKVTNTLNLVFISVLFLFIVLQLFINTTIFTQLLGWSKYASAIFVGLIVLLYTTIGGLKAEIFTDAFQGILMLMIVALLFMVDTTTITSDEVNSIIADRSLLFGALCLGLTQLLTLLVQPEMWQRVAAARSLEHLKKGFIASWVFLVIVAIPIIIIGLAARGSGTVEDPQILFYHILNTAAPAWYFPFLIVSLFAAFMSTLDSSLFAISSQLGKYGIVIKKAGAYREESFINNDVKVARNIRISVIAVLILSLIVSLFFVNFLIGVFNLISLLTVISATVLISFIFKMSSNETFVALLVGIMAFMVAFLGGYITEQPVTTLYPSFVLTGYMLLQKGVIQIYRLRNRS